MYFPSGHFKAIRDPLRRREFGKLPDSAFSIKICQKWASTDFLNTTFISPFHCKIIDITCMCIRHVVMGAYRVADKILG